ncbi:MAG TPA: hypothetical protein VK304_03195 [Thermoleophilaceae bacterium]|nr:hypothetical protein [Thermoleophilaceae bacterium]
MVVLADIEGSKFTHVLGAMLLMGALVVVFAASVQAKRGDTPFLLRLAFRGLLLGALPAWVLMRVGAQWAYSEGSYDAARTEPGWIGFGFITSELGLLLLIAATVVAGLASRRLSRGEASAGALQPWSQGLVGVLIVLYVVTIFAMSAKPD